MGLGNPAALLWLPPLGGLIVLLYILKLRRKDVVVSSTLLWQRVIRDVQANAPFQRLRPNALLLLQLLALALIALAAAKPYSQSVVRGGRIEVIVLESSASMEATDIPTSRLASAKAIALNLVEDLHPGDMAVVLSAWARPQPLTGFSDDKEQLERAIRAIRPHDTPCDMRAALRLAQDLASSRAAGHAGRIDLISDGDFAGNGIDTGGARLVTHRIGTRGENVAITSLDYRRSLADPATFQLLVVAHNYGMAARRFDEEILLGDNLIDAHEVGLAAGAESVEPFTLQYPQTTETITARLDVKDDLAVDNQASIVVRPFKTLSVLLVGPHDGYLENALAVIPNVQLSTAARYLSGYDVDVFNGQAPPNLPAGNYLFIHCGSTAAPATLGKGTGNSEAVDWQREDPLMRYVDLSGDRFGAVLNVSPRPWAREIVSGASGALVLAGERSGTRSELLAFSPSRSLFALKIAFPILMSNSVEWLGGAEEQPGQYATGSVVTLPAPPPAAQIEVTGPDGAKHIPSTNAAGRPQCSATDQAGIYQATGRNYRWIFAANLDSPE
ncbi:MAG TPA: BatA and WFA domain-containing protein, partial [Chthonomonadales bacterium]|nr:BatA and WFA domain-containing protein [Chthonomonadales bacterium]